MAWPPETAPLPIRDPLSSNWIVPVAPGTAEAMEAVKTTVWPTTDCADALATVTVVAASATLTVAGAVVVLVAKVGSPLYVAVRSWGPSTRLEVSRLAVATPPAVETFTVASGADQSENVTVPPGLTAAPPGRRDGGDHDGGLAVDGAGRR